MRRNVVVVGIVMLFVGIGVGYFIAFVQFLNEVRGTFEEVTANLAGEKSNVKVRVVASQYSWDFHYPGSDGVFGATSLERISESNRLGLDPSDPNGADDFSTSELVLPCGTTVGLIVTSADVIHAIGELEGDFTADAIPGSDITNGLLTPDSPRDGRFRCVQLCGSGHDGHTAEYRFLAEDDFVSWLASQYVEVES